MHKALIIGCGNIGAQYDLYGKDIKTYAKAFYCDPDITFDVYDYDEQVSSIISGRYSAKKITSLNDLTFSNYDIVVISSPTYTHFDYLSTLLDSGPKLIICEKPICTVGDKLSLLKEKYENSASEVIVNFFRRFQPEIINLKKYIQKLNSHEQCRNVHIAYQRGFHNNCSHAIDLLEFLFQKKIDFSSAKIFNSVHDEFYDDPTLSMHIDWKGTNLNILGLSNSKFSHLEINIYFEKTAISFTNNSNLVNIFTTGQIKRGKNYPVLSLSKTIKNVTKNYMANVTNVAKLILSGKTDLSNFLESIDISRRMIQIKGISGE